MPVEDDEYVPLTDDQLYGQQADDLEDISDGDAEDFEGSAIQSLIRGNSRLLARNQEQTLSDLYDAGYLETANGSALDKKAQENGIARKPATPATGVARFFRNSEPTTDYTIKRNLVITTANGEVDFLTTESGALQLLTGFDSSSLDSAWSGDTSSFGTQTTTVDDDTHALEVPATSGADIYRTDITVSEGDRFRASLYLPSGGAVDVRFALEGSGTFYAAIVDEGAGTLELIESDGGTESQLDSTAVAVPNGVWITVEIDWRTTDEVTVRLDDDTDTTLDSVEAPIGVSSGGIGIGSRSGTTTEYVDTLCTTATALNIEGAEGGTETNVGSDRIRVLSTQPTGVDGVFNPLPTGDDQYKDTDGRQFIIGKNREDDEELRNRALKSTAKGGAATVNAIGSALRGIDDVIGVTAFENDDLSEDGDGRPALSVEFVVYGGKDADIAQVIHDKVALTERLSGGHVGSLKSYTITDDLLADDETYEWSEPPIDNLDITIDVVTDSTYEGDDAVKSAIVKYIGGTDVDGSVETGTSVGIDIRVDEIRNRVVGDDLGVKGIASITIDSDGDGTDDTTTDGDGLTVYAVAKSDVAETDATDGSIVVN